jgi:hypothetical protein
VNSILPDWLMQRLVGMTMAPETTRTTTTTPTHSVELHSIRSNLVRMIHPESVSKVTFIHTSTCIREVNYSTGEFGGIGHNVSIDHLWNVYEALITINQTYEIDETLDAWNYRGHELLGELLYQVKNYACSGGVWTQTTDVEGEVNGMLTYDRRFLRPDLAQWNADISALHDAAASRSNSTARLF